MEKYIQRRTLRDKETGEITVSKLQEEFRQNQKLLGKLLRGNQK